MCESLIYARIDPPTDLLRYQIGDFVTVQKNGWGWTAMESKAAWAAAGLNTTQWPKTFVVLKTPEISVSKMQSMLQHWDDVVGRLYKRRMRFLDIDASPQQIRNKIGSDYEITLTKDQIRSFIKNKADGSVYDPGWDD